MKKISYLVVAFLIFGATSLRAQLIDEKDVTITMDLQPVLQLDMTTPDQIEFVFDNINEYFAGITHYGATILKVSSTVSWDLYAVGRSSGSNGAGFWDQQIAYGSGTNTNAIANLPISLLELRQSQPNAGASAAALASYADYSASFTAAGTPSGQNSLYVNGGSNTPPSLADKYIGGHAGTTGTGDFLPGGSYLTQTGTTSNYYYSMDYRILPGLPAIFPNAYSADGLTAQDIVTANAAGNYAEPGVYTMFVQYVLLEDQ
ncbi:MAG: hypothetical protein L3J45_00700 [Flavobacteriaceae bacterium]|nr:hypothetical protein [Flavobacteriaceae bacterium]